MPQSILLPPSAPTLAMCSAPHSIWQDFSHGERRWRQNFIPGFTWRPAVSGPVSLVAAAATIAPNPTPSPPDSRVSQSPYKNPGTSSVVPKHGCTWFPSPWKIWFYRSAVRPRHLYFNSCGDFNATFHLINILRPISNILVLFKFTVHMALLGTLLKGRFWFSRSRVDPRVCISKSKAPFLFLLSLESNLEHSSLVLLCQKTSLLLVWECQVLRFLSSRELPKYLETKSIAHRDGERSPWVLGDELAVSLTGRHQMAFIIVAGICLCLYFLFLCFMVFQVFRNISGKQSSLSAMSKVRRLHYEVSTSLGSFRSWCSPSPAWCEHTHTPPATPGDVGEMEAFIPNTQWEILM